MTTPSGRDPIPRDTTELRIDPRVRGDLERGRPVIALESTIFSRFGLPAPHNEAALFRCLAAVHAEGARPALLAVLDGAVRVGVAPEEHNRVLAASTKVGERDLPWAVAARLSSGALTVSASVAVAARAGVSVFATGGIGGVHRGAELSFDVSADLGALARHPVAVVSAGAKGFLDLPKTLETLDTLGVPVVGFGTDDFPAFWSRESGLRAPRRVDDADTAARMLHAAHALGRTAGALFVVPCPEADAIPRAEIERAIDDALAAVDAEGIHGDAVTPYVLARLAHATAGRTLAANVALAERNAAVASRIAVALARIESAG